LSTQPSRYIVRKGTEAAHVTQFLERVHSLDDGLGPLGAEDGRHQITNFSRFTESVFRGFSFVPDA